ncbi:MAG TPA: D-alanyl-D-alanine-carboxypeptidase/endopeptidase AmpH [Geminicoccaceae bacterium]|nr:D-alanyl-D-alanine-carboxypeptidase/endopeptidase AmpH [Geminicoccaceae bacterium]
MRLACNRIGTLLLVPLLMAPVMARAQSPLLEEAVGLSGLAMFLDSGAVGMVLAVVNGDDHVVVGFGETEEGNGKEPNGKSVLRLGSGTKVFAGELLAGLAAEGRLSLTDPLQRFAPDGAKIPEFEGRPITLLDLATHSAALPRELPLDPPPNSPPFAWPTAADRFAWLAGYTLPWAPGSVAAYSNVGFDLLSAALATAAGESYQDLLRERITGPLGMSDTVLEPSDDQCARLMIGYGIPGAEAQPCVSTVNIGGSGGLYTTADDMVLWLRHCLARTDPAVWATLALAHTPYLERSALHAAIGFDEAGTTDGIALAWLFQRPADHRPAILQKSGGLAGFMSFMVFAPGRGVGVFVAVNKIDFEMFAGLTEGADELIASLAPH